MAILSFLVHLFGAIMLLLFAVRMVRTGIERSFGASFKRLLTRNQGVAASSMTGLMMAVVLQSSAAVALLAAGFAASGYLAFPAGLAVVLGGDLGSALIIQVLSFKLDWLVPLLLSVGGWLFVKTEQRRWRQAGRILMGIAFILISLQFLRQAMDPIRDGAVLPALAEYLARDFLTAFIVGGALAFVMHSSVAAILMCVTLVQIGAIPFAAALSLVLGANFGSALIPIYLARNMPVAARRIPLANLALRGTWALAVLLIINLAADPQYLLLASPGQSLVYSHIMFNTALVLLALPLCRPLESVMQLVLPAKAADDAGIENLEASSALDAAVIDNPQLAIASLKRELLRMIDILDRMFQCIPELYETGDTRRIKSLCAQDQPVDAALSEIRRYVASMPAATYSKNDLKTVRGLMDFAIRLETAGDAISKRLTEIISKKHESDARFSKEGWAELLHMHEAIQDNLKLASNVLISDDLESARLLVREKAELKQIERKSRKHHLRRLQDGRKESFESSDVHLETLRVLRDINSHVSAIAYPILYRNGQLLETRLIEDMDAARAAG